MKALCITLNDDDTVEITSETDLNFGEALGLCIDAVESLLNHAVESFGDNKEFKDQLHDYISYASAAVIGRVFPEDSDFDLTDAAIYKAQNEILEESMDTGVPVEEVIARYNKEAEEYVNEAREVS